MIGIIKSFSFPCANHLHQLIFNKDYRKYFYLESKLKKIPRFTPCNIRTCGWDLSMPDSASFLSTYKEIFVEKIYAFKFETDVPRILDLGANIGLSVMYFKQLFPKAQITAFEADTKIFEYLKKNVYGNGYKDVQIMNKAAWIEDTIIKFSSEGADGGRAAFSGDENIVEVEALNIADYLKNNKFDFLKMDIEGAEEFVFPACQEFLPDMRYVFVEYHSRAIHKQCLDRIIGILAEEGFRIHIHSALYSQSPFVKINTNVGFDLQLNIFGWKD